MRSGRHMVLAFVAALVLASRGHAAPADATDAAPTTRPAPPSAVDAAGATDTAREEVETAAGRRAPDGANEVRQSPLEAAVASRLRSECARRDASACLKLKLIAYLNKLLKKATIPLTDAVEIARRTTLEEGAEGVDGGEWRGGGGVGVEEALGVVVAEKVSAFVRTRSLRWALTPEAALVLTPDADPEGTVTVGVSVRAGRTSDATAAATGRGRLKQLLPILGAVKIKIGILVALAIAALALLVGKAVVISKIALVLAGILGIIKLMSKPQKTVSYEVVSHPHHSQSHGSSTVVEAGHHHHDAYGRRSMDGAELAYRAHAA